MPVPHPTRRAALAAALGVAATATAGCRPFGGAKAAPDPDELVVRRVVAGKRQLVGRYEATLRTHPALAPRLEPLLAEHRRHLAALHAATPAPTPTASAAPGGEVPATASAALSALATAEQAAAGSRIPDVLAASPRLARVLASVGACESAHAALLSGVRP